MAAHYHHLTIDNATYNTVWLDAMHDRTNYKANEPATIDDDLLMTIVRSWPNKPAVKFLELFKGKYILESKDDVINAIPGEMRIKDVYSGMFFGFALNEFIDQADTSTENYLKYYQSKKPGLINTNFAGLPIADFPNSFLYNCDMRLFEYFIAQPQRAGPVPAAAVGQPRQVAPIPGRANFDDRTYTYVDATSVDPMDPVNPVITPWSITNCKQRHLYNLNCFWQELINTIASDHGDVRGPDDSFEPQHTANAISCLKRIVFTDFKMLKKTKVLGNRDVSDFLYQYPKWKIDGIGEEFFYVTTRGLCASNIPTPTGANVLSRKLGKTTKEQKSCFKGLITLATRCALSPAAKSHFFMLLKYAGDTSHIVLYEILNYTVRNPGDKTNLALYLSERPLLVRAFAKNMNVYCKYLAKFKDEGIIKTPNEVFKLTTIKDNVIGFMRAKNYMEDIERLKTHLTNDLRDHNILNDLKLQSVHLPPPPPPAVPPPPPPLHSNNIDVAITTATAVGNESKLSQADQDRIDKYHNFIKQILSFYELIVKTPDFIEDMEYVNERIIARKFFPTRRFRCPIIMHLKSVACTMVRNAFNKKNIEILYRALEYLNAHRTLQSIDPSLQIANEVPLVNMYNELKTKLQDEIVGYQIKFTKLNQISIDAAVSDVRNADPSKLRDWIDNQYTSESSMTNKLTDVGIQNITDYLILYDTLYDTLPPRTGDDGANQGGGAAQVGDEDKSWWRFLVLDETLVKEEDEILAKAIPTGYIEYLDDIDSRIDDIVNIENSVEPPPLGAVDDHVRTITSSIYQLVVVVNDADFLEALYYILQQFTYFNESTDIEYITTERLNIHTLQIISNTMEQILPKEIEENFTNMVTAGIVVAKLAVEGSKADPALFAQEQARLAQEQAQLAQEQAAAGIFVDDTGMDVNTGMAKAKAAAANTWFDDAGTVVGEPRMAKAAAMSEAMVVNATNDQPDQPTRGALKRGRRPVRGFDEERDTSPLRKLVKGLPRRVEKPIRIRMDMGVGGGANKTRKISKSSQLRKTIKKRRVKKIKRKSLRRRKPIKKRVNSKNRKVRRKIKNKTRKYKKPKKQKRSRKPKP